MKNATPKPQTNLKAKLEPPKYSSKIEIKWKKGSR